MPGCEAWDVVKVPFPYTNRPVQQRRPALVIGAPATGGGPSLLWVLMVTSAENRAWPGDVPIPDLAAAGLPVPSVIRTAKIATIEAAHAEPIGHLPPQHRPAVAEALRVNLAAAL